MSETPANYGDTAGTFAAPFPTDPQAPPPVRPPPSGMDYLDNELGTKAPETIDQAHDRLGHTAPRVTPADIEANIAAMYFVTGDRAVGDVPIHPLLKLLTLCVVVLRNGFVIIGKSAPVSGDNFSIELGTKFAREDALKQIWPLMGYALREQLSKQDER